MRYLTITMALLTCMSLIACEEKVSTGTVEMTDAARQRRGNIAPVLPVMTESGRLVELGEVAEPIMVVAFVDTQSKCGYVSPNLKQLAANLNLDSVTVVQISEGCTKCQQLVEKVRADAENFIVLCDGKGVASNAFKKPALDSVYLIDQDDRIVMETTTNDLPRVRREAKRLNKEYEERLRTLLRSN